MIDQEMIESTEYRELLEQLRICRPGKEARLLHKKLKKYGSGMFFRLRYPNFNLYISVAALVLSLSVFLKACCSAATL